MFQIRECYIDSIINAHSEIMEKSAIGQVVHFHMPPAKQCWNRLYGIVIVQQWHREVKHFVGVPYA